jgi:hypothetical protein
MKHIANTKHKHVAKNLKHQQEIQQPLLLPAFSFRAAHHFCIK